MHYRFEAAILQIFTLIRK